MEENNENFPKRPAPDRGYTRFIKTVLGKNDLVSMVIRGHLLVEYYLNELIILLFDQGDKIIVSKDIEFRYLHKIAILKSFKSMSTISRHLDASSALNKVRNDCAHKLEYDVKISDINKIGLPFGREYIELRHQYSDQPLVLLVNTLMLVITGFEAAREWTLEDSKK